MRLDAKRCTRGAGRYASSYHAELEADLMEVVPADRGQRRVLQLRLSHMLELATLEKAAASSAAQQQVGE